MSLTVVKGLQSEIFVPITPPAVWTPVTKELKDMSIALATAAGVHKKSQERFNLAGDFTLDMITVMLTKTSTACSPSTESMSWLQRASSEPALRYTPDSWAAAETRRNSKEKLVRLSHRCLKKRM